MRERRQKGPCSPRQVLQGGQAARGPCGCGGGARQRSPTQHLFTMATVAAMTCMG